MTTKRSPVENAVRRYLLGDSEWHELRRRLEVLRLKDAEDTRLANQVLDLMDNNPHRYPVFRAWYAFMTRYRKNLKEDMG